MIVVNGSGESLERIRVRVGKEIMTLGPNSDPELLFAVIKKMSKYILGTRKNG